MTVMADIPHADAPTVASESLALGLRGKKPRRKFIRFTSDESDSFWDRFFCDKA